MTYLNPLEWPVAQPDDLLDYSLDLTAPFASIGDTIGSVSVSISPQNELQASNLSFADGVVSVWLGNGGIAGRTYHVKVDAVGANTGMEISKIVALPISSITATYPLPAAVTGWSTPVTDSTPVTTNDIVTQDGSIMTINGVLPLNLHSR